MKVSEPSTMALEFPGMAFKLGGKRALYSICVFKFKLRNNSWFFLFYLWNWPHVSVPDWTIWLFTSHYGTDSWEFGHSDCLFYLSLHVCTHLPSSSDVLRSGVVIMCVHSEWSGTWFTVNDGASLTHTGVYLPSPLFLCYLWCRHFLM